MASSADRSYLLGELVELVGGTLRGDASTPVIGVSSLEQPVPGTISFIRTPADTRYQEQLAGSKLAALVAPYRADGTPAISSDLPLILVDNPLAAMIKIVGLFHPVVRPAAGLSPKAEIDATAKIGKNVSVGPFTAIGAKVQIGDDCVIYPNVTIYQGVTIGSGTTIHAGAVIREGCRLGRGSVVQNGAVVGADGFGYVPDPQAGLRPVPQVGIVELADGVDIGANSCVDRATLGSTRVGAGTKIDNLVQIGHNVQIGSYSIVCGMAGVAGSTKIGNNVVLGAGVGISDHLTVVDGVRLGTRSGVSQDITEPGDYIGSPMQPLPAFAWRKLQLALKELPRLVKQLRSLRGASDSE